MTIRVDHIGIAVKSIEAAKSFWEEALGVKLTGEEVISEQKVKVGFFPMGESEVELLEPTEPDSPVAKFIEKKGEGIQHVAFRVENIEKTLADLKAKGVRLIDEKPRYGAGGAKIAFIHPKATFGTLVEICQRD